MSDLITWLGAQLDEDERIALAANPGPWRRFTDKDHLDPMTIFGGRWMGDAEKLRNVASLMYAWEKDGNAEHIVRWDPARVLAEVKAKRAILDMDVDEIGDCCPDCGDHAADKVHGVAVHLLAQPYAGREGWRDEWSVT